MVENALAAASILLSVDSKEALRLNDVFSGSTFPENALELREDSRQRKEKEEVK